MWSLTSLRTVPSRRSMLGMPCKGLSHHCWAIRCWRIVRTFRNGDLDCDGHQARALEDCYIGVDNRAGANLHHERGPAVAVADEGDEFAVVDVSALRLALQ